MPDEKTPFKLSRTRIVAIEGAVENGLVSVVRADGGLTFMTVETWNEMGRLQDEHNRRTANRKNRDAEVVLILANLVMHKVLKYTSYYLGAEPPGARVLRALAEELHALGNNIDTGKVTLPTDGESTSAWLARGGNKP